MRLRHITMTIECGIKTIIQSHRNPPQKKFERLKNVECSCLCAVLKKKIISFLSSSCPSCPVFSSSWPQRQPSSFQRQPSSWRQRQLFSWRQPPSSSWQPQPFVLFSFQRQPSSFQRQPSFCRQPPSSSWQPQPSALFSFQRQLSYF